MRLLPRNHTTIMQEHAGNSALEKHHRLHVAELTMSAQRALHAYMIEKTGKIAKPEAKKKVFSFCL